MFVLHVAVRTIAPPPMHPQTFVVIPFEKRFTMSQRIASAVALLMLVSVAGCGQVHRSIAPEADIAGEGAVTNAATLAKLDLADAALDSDDDDDRPGWHARATAINGPTTITRPGDYRLASNLQIASGDGIVIKANRVRLWLGDYRLRGPGNKQGRAITIDGAEDVKIRGGKIERFGIGVAAIGSSDCSIKGVSIRGGDETADPANGNPPQIGILLVNSSENRISRNHLHDVNLGIFVRGGGSYENVIRRNEVVAGDHGLLGICYNPAMGEGPAGPRKDRVTYNTLNRFNTGIQTSAQSERNLFRNNSISYFTAAYEDLNGSNIFERNRTRQITP